MFSRRHYTRIALTMHEDMPPNYRGVQQTQYEKWVETVLRLGDMLDRDNERFDRVKFNVACGLE
jgi:hypothetical protein